MAERRDQTCPKSARRDIANEMPRQQSPDTITDTEPGTDPSSNQTLLLSLFGDFKDSCCDHSSASDESDKFPPHLDDILPIWLAAIMEYIIAATLETPSSGVRTADYQYAAR